MKNFRETAGGIEPEIYEKKFPDGAFIKYDVEKSRLDISCPGEIHIDGGKIFLQGTPYINFGGEVQKWYEEKFSRENKDETRRNYDEEKIVRDIVGCLDDLPLPFALYLLEKTKEKLCKNNPDFQSPVEVNGKSFREVAGNKFPEMLSNDGWDYLCGRKPLIWPGNYFVFKKVKEND